MKSIIIYQEEENQTKKLIQQSEIVINDLTHLYGFKTFGKGADLEAKEFHKKLISNSCGKFYQALFKEMKKGGYIQ